MKLKRTVTVVGALAAALAGTLAGARLYRQNSQLTAAANTVIDQLGQTLHAYHALLRLLAHDAVSVSNEVAKLVGELGIMAKPEASPWDISAFTKLTNLEILKIHVTGPTELIEALQEKIGDSGLPLNAAAVIIEGDTGDALFVELTTSEPGLAKIVRDKIAVV